MKKLHGRGAGKHLSPADRKRLRRVLMKGQGVMHAARTLGCSPTTAISEARRMKAEGIRIPAPVAVRDVMSKGPPPDPIELRRARESLKEAQARARAAETRAIKAEDVRAAVLGLASEPLRPEGWNPQPRKGQGQPEAIVLPISDIHMGEVIDLAAMDGRNAYSLDIAAARLRRYFETVVKLGTQHWSGPPPSVIYAVLLGDLVSGEIHEELAKTNDAQAIPAVRRVAECLISGFDLLLKSFACPIRVVALPGNHGRTTKKPESKGFAVNSFDTLAAWQIEAWYTARGEKRISFSAPPSGDALLNINGWNLLFTHGDRIGSRGGQGFVGVSATAARGMKKLIQDYAAGNQIVDKVVIGHFHTPLQLEEGFVNGSFSGSSEYARAGRMRPHPASQWMLTVHPRHGVARRWDVVVGDPSEGSIYKGRGA